MECRKFIWNVGSLWNVRSLYEMSDVYMGGGIQEHPQDLLGVS